MKAWRQEWFGSDQTREIEQTESWRQGWYGGASR